LSHFGVSGDDYLLTQEQIASYQSNGDLVLRHLVRETGLHGIEPTLKRFMRGEVIDMGRDSCDMSGPYGRAFEDFNSSMRCCPAFTNQC
jgi:hypothetical protein